MLWIFLPGQKLSFSAIFQSRPKPPYTMIKNYLIFYLLFICVSSQAQYAPFPTPGLEHGAIYICNPFDCASYFNFSSRYGGDTVLCGYNWSQFGQYIRTEQGKYYMRTSNCNETLLYDFSKNVGDTVFTSDLGALKVLETGIFTLDNGAQRKKLILEQIAGGFGQQHIWVDGIGDINRGFFRASDFEGGYSQLICIRDSSGMIYHNPSPFFALDCDSLLCKLPFAAFEYSCSDQTYYFSNHSKNATSYFWDFGDGESSTDANPTHTYVNPGCYTVYLNATSDCLPDPYITARRIAVNTPFFWKKSPHDTPVPFTKMQFLDPQHGWALGEQKIWKTSDGGAHWDTLPYPGPVRTLVNLQFKDFEHGIIQILKPNSPYYSEILWTNDGQNFEVQSLGDSPSITALERLNDSVAVVADHYNDIFATQDGGQNWSQISLPGAISLISDFEAIEGGGVYFIGISQLFPPYNKFGFGKSADALQWEVQEFPDIQGAWKMSFVNAQQGWISTNTGILHTQDAGETWSLQEKLSGTSFELDFIDSLHGWASGHQTGIYATSNGGLTWEQQACARSSESMRGLNVFSPTQAYILFNDGLYHYSIVPDTIKLCETISTKTPEPDAKSQFSLYPNPSSGVLNIQWTGLEPAPASWILYNAQAQEMLRWPGTQTNISIADLPAGLYWLTGVNEEGKNLGTMQKLVLIK